MQSRRQFIKITGLASAALMLPWKGTFRKALAVPIPGGTLDPESITKYQTPLLIPPAMPRSTKLNVQMDKNVDYYEIAVRQFQQQILPLGMPATTVWSYGSLAAPGTVAQGGSFNYPAFTIESKYNRHVRVKWVNDLVDENKNPLPHLLPVDPTLHWANPIGARDMRPDPDDLNYWMQPLIDQNNGNYVGPVPLVTHVHGAHTTQDSDGYPEAWYLPAGATGVNWTEGSSYALFAAEFAARYPDYPWWSGHAVFEYPNDMRATTLWYHDHTLGMTRLNVYAGPAGFFIIRGGPDDMVLDLKGKPAVLPGPAPALGDLPGTKYYEIPIVIQDRSFNSDGSLFYPDVRAFFEGLEAEHLRTPFTPDSTLGGEPSDVAPIWQPEFFANTMVVNGNTWPFLNVEQRRYRFRLLNGCNSRFLILGFSTNGVEVDPNVVVHQIGADGGFLPAPMDIATNSPYPGMILMAPAERADVIVDFGLLPAGTKVTLLNAGPDEPFGGGVIGTDFDPADADTTGQVMQFIVTAAKGRDPSTPVNELVLPAILPLLPTNTRQVSLNEEESKVVFVPVDQEGEFVLDTNGTLWAVPEGSNSTWDLSAILPNVTWEEAWTAGRFGPTAALLGTLAPNPQDPQGGLGRLWMQPVTENPAAGTTEEWEIYNFTMDAHPIHIHLVQFQVVGREVIDDPNATSVAGSNLPLPGETGFKDTVIAYPGEITRVRASFDTPGRFVWHCHIVEHEDNEMMRPYDVV